MAIYWIDFMQSTNGTGTYASPFSGATAQTLVAGDEIRVKSVLKSSIWDASFGNLTPGSYKMIYNSNKNGGGAPTNNMLFKHNTEAAISFNSTYLYYIVELDSYFMTQNSTFSSSTFNSITETFIYTSPIYIPISWNDGLDHTITVKLVSVNYRTKAHTGSQTFIGPALVAVDNITITDGWINATTRLTDGTAVTIYQSGYTSSSSYFYLRYLKGNSIVDLGNTVFTDKVYGGNYYLQQNIDYCGPTNITLGTKISTYGSVSPLQINNYDDTVVGNFLLTVKNYSSFATSGYFPVHTSTDTLKLSVTFDIQKLAIYNCNCSIGHTNNNNNFNLKLGHVSITGYSLYNTAYGSIFSGTTNPSFPYLTLYGEFAVTQPINDVDNRIAFIAGDYAAKVLKKFDTLFNLSGIVLPNTVSATTPAKNGCFFSVLTDSQNNFFNIVISPSLNTSSYIFPIANTIITNNKKNLNGLQYNQIEYNPIKTTVLGISKAAANFIYSASYSINLSHGNALYFPQNDNYIYFLAKTNDSITNETSYTYAANRCLMEENNVTFKTVAPSYKISVDGSTSSYKEFFHRWNIPVEAGTTYTIKFYTSIIGSLPSTYFKNYNFALRYNYSSVINSTITSLSQGGWEEQLFTFTSSYAQILSLDMFLTQSQNMTSELYISDFTVKSI